MLAQVTSEMRRYKLDVLGISESRWTGAGRMKNFYMQAKQYLYSRKDSYHCEGVAIILKKGIEKSIIEWKHVNSRLIKVNERQIGGHY